MRAAAQVSSREAVLSGAYRRNTGVKFTGTPLTTERGLDQAQE